MISGKTTLIDRVAPGTFVAVSPIPA